MSWVEEQDWFGLEDLIVEDERYFNHALNKDIWIDRKNKKHLISKMTTYHIINCINMINRSNTKWRSMYLGRLTSELFKRNLLKLKSRNHD